MHKEKYEQIVEILREKKIKQCFTPNNPQSCQNNAYSMLRAIQFQKYCKNFFLKKLEIYRIRDTGLARFLFIFTPENASVHD